MHKPKVLLFDLGGVIVRWVGLEALSELTGQSREALIDTHNANPIMSAYEVGECHDDDFAAVMVESFDLDMSLPTFKKLWQSWVQDIYSGIPAALKTLRKDYVTACLSNTNHLHWEHLGTYFKPEDKFDIAIASHHIGKAKPDVDSYHITIEKLGVSPDEIWFFDDTEVNVEAARTLGIKAYHVDRNVGVLPNLHALNLLS